MLILTLHSVVGSSSRGDTPGKAFRRPYSRSGAVERFGAILVE